MKTNARARADQRSAPRVLVVDDSAGMRLYLCAILSTLQVSVVEADNGGAAFAEILASDFDLVITDLMMDKADGFGLISAISLLPNDRARPPVIVCSSLDPDSEAMQRPELRLAKKILTKPVGATEVVEAVSKALGGLGTASKA